MLLPSATLNELMAERFRALSDPARLRLLMALGTQERTVTQLVERSRLGQANVSRHLQQLHAMGFVARRKDGLCVRYRVADAGVMRLCDLACAPAKAWAGKRRG